MGIYGPKTVEIMGDFGALNDEEQYNLYSSLHTTVMIK
jgi:hypothetical protein